MAGALNQQLDASGQRRFATDPQSLLHGRGGSQDVRIASRKIWDDMEEDRSDNHLE